MKYLIAVGACYVDTILSLPYYPGEDEKLRASKLTVRRGGNCPNALEVLQQLITPNDALLPCLVSSLPHKDSPATQRILSSFGDDTTLSFEHCLFREDRTEPASCYVLRSEQSGSRTIVNYNDHPDITTEDFERIVDRFSPDQETWWHFEGRNPMTTIQFIRHLRRVLPMAKISVEIEKPGREGLLELAAEGDVVFFARGWAEGRGHDSPETCLRGERLRSQCLALCTWGAEGAAALSYPPGEMIRYPSFENRRDVAVVDSVGAGDTFIAGMLYGLMCHAEDWNTGRKLAFAVDLATQKVQREGFAGLGEACRVLNANQ